MHLLTDPAAPGGRIGVILHSVEARFRRPVTFPDTLLVSSRLLDIAADSSHPAVARERAFGRLLSHLVHRRPSADHGHAQAA